MPLLRRVGRPGLLGTAARTAVIAGTASATAGAVRRRQDARAEQTWEQQQLAAAEEQRRFEDAARQAAQQQAVVAPAPGAGSDDLVTRIQQLASLHTAGALSDAEFAAAKSRLLGG